MYNTDTDFDNAHSYTGNLYVDEDDYEVRNEEGYVDQEKTIAKFKRLGYSLMSAQIHPSENFRGAGHDAKQNHYAFKRWFKKQRDPKYAFWLAFEIVYGALKLDAWDGSMTLGSSVMTTDQLVHNLEEVLGAICPLSPQQLSRKIAQSFAAKDPVKSYLEALPDATDQDRQMFDNLAVTLFGQQQDRLAQTKLSRWLIGAVSRVMQPGCKMDSALVIKGKQGIGKTSFLAALFGKHFRTLHSHIKDVEKQRLIAQAWGCELGEIEATFRATDISALKAFLTETHDAVRKIYTEDIPNKERHCVFAGTTNEAAFLNDPTGSRRFWVIDADSHIIPVEWVKEHRDRIWAVALELYTQEEPWWMTTEEAALNEVANKAFQNENSYIGAIAPYLSHYEQMPDVAGKGIAVSIADVMTALLDIKPEAHKRNNKEVSNALTELGYIKKRINNKRFSGYYFYSPDATDPCILKLNRANGAIGLEGSQMATKEERKAWQEQDI